MSGLGQVAKRLLVGRPYASDRASEQLLPKRIALPVFASDPLSSVAYATEEILLVLSLGGLALLHLSVPVAAGVVSGAGPGRRAPTGETNPAGLPASISLTPDAGAGTSAGAPPEASCKQVTRIENAAVGSDPGAAGWGFLRS